MVDCNKEFPIGLLQYIVTVIVPNTEDVDIQCIVTVTVPNTEDVDIQCMVTVIVPNTEDVDIQCIVTVIVPNTEDNTLSGRIGKVFASHAAVGRSSPAEVALIYAMHEALRGYCP